MDLNEIRKEIDAVDALLLPLFVKRMRLSDAVADYKRENGLPTRNVQREQEILDRVSKEAGEEYGPYAAKLYETVMSLSRARQDALREEKSGE